MPEVTRPLRVAIADDALLLREGIAKVLEGGGIEVVASVGTGAELLEVASARQPRRGGARHPHAAEHPRRGHRRARADARRRLDRSACCCSRCTRPPSTLCASWARAAAPATS